MCGMYTISTSTSTSTRYYWSLLSSVILCFVKLRKDALILILLNGNMWWWIDKRRWARDKINFDWFYHQWIEFEKSRQVTNENMFEVINSFSHVQFSLTMIYITPDVTIIFVSSLNSFDFIITFLPIKIHDFRILRFLRITV